MDNNKALGPDGYVVYFFEMAWDIVNNNVVQVIRHFFANGHLLKEVNCTILTLIPKVANPLSCKDFRPIACCNTIYKCISKILANCLKHILPLFINKAQTTIMEGKSIGDNIIFFQDLMHNYHKEYKDKKCAIKVDLMKA